jgi:hypothetical protein
VAQDDEGGGSALRSAAVGAAAGAAVGAAAGAAKNMLGSDADGGGAEDGDEAPSSSDGEAA